MRLSKEELEVGVAALWNYWHSYKDDEEEDVRQSAQVASELAESFQTYLDAEDYDDVNE